MIKILIAFLITAAFGAYACLIVGARAERAWDAAREAKEAHEKHL